MLLESKKLRQELISEEVSSQKPPWEQAEVVTAAVCAGKTRNLLFQEEGAWGAGKVEDLLGSTGP